MKTIYNAKLWSLLLHGLFKLDFSCSSSWICPLKIDLVMIHELSSLCLWSFYLVLSLLYLKSFNFTKISHLNANWKYVRQAENIFLTLGYSTAIRIFIFWIENWKNHREDSFKEIIERDENLNRIDVDSCDETLHCLVLFREDVEVVNMKIKREKRYTLI